jgi:hypothetical protein
LTAAARSIQSSALGWVFAVGVVVVMLRTS